MNAGRVVPVFVSNLNTGGSRGSELMTARATFAAGPRILSGSMGPISGAQLSSFTVTFDRPVDASTFTGDDVTLHTRPS